MPQSENFQKARGATRPGVSLSVTLLQILQLGHVRTVLQYVLEPETDARNPQKCAAPKGTSIGVISCDQCLHCASDLIASQAVIAARQVNPVAMHVLPGHDRARNDARAAVNGWQCGEGNVMNASPLQGLQSDALRMFRMSTLCEGCPQQPFGQFRASGLALRDL